MRIGRKPPAMSFSVSSDYRFDQLVKAVLPPELHQQVYDMIGRRAVSAKPRRIGRSRWFLSENNPGALDHELTLTVVVNDLDRAARSSIRIAGEGTAATFRFEP